jgi:hypothetical protein
MVPLGSAGAKGDKRQAEEDEIINGKTLRSPKHR